MIPEFQPSDFTDSFDLMPESMFNIFKLIHSIGTAFLESIWSWAQAHQSEIQALTVPFFLGVMGIFLFYMGFKAFVRGASRSTDAED